MPRKELVDEAAEKVARYLNIEPERLARNDRGVVLTPTQIEVLVAALLAQGSRSGYRRAIDTLRETAANIEGKGQNNTEWAAFVGIASFLEGIMS